MFLKNVFINEQKYIFKLNLTVDTKTQNTNGLLVKNGEQTKWTLFGKYVHTIQLAGQGGKSRVLDHFHGLSS